MNDTRTTTNHTNPHLFEEELDLPDVDLHDVDLHDIVPHDIGLHGATRAPGGAPSTGQISALARQQAKAGHTPAPQLPAQMAPVDVLWVRPSELLAGAGSRILGRGVNFQAKPARHTFALPRHAARLAIRYCERLLPPVSTFGHRGSHEPPTVRTGLR